MGIEQNKMVQDKFDNDEISLKEIILKVKEWYYYLLTKWNIIILSALIGGLIGLTISIFDKPTYKAVLTFAMEDDKGGGLSGALGLASSIGIDLSSAGGGGAFAASNIAELMKSRLIVQKTLLEPIVLKDKLTTLAEYYIEINHLREAWKSNPTLSRVDLKKPFENNSLNFQQDSILKQIHKELINKNRLSIAQKDKKVTILTIEVNNEDELFSQKFCENLAKQTSDFYIETKSKKARLNVDVLQKQVDSVRGELSGSIIGVAKEIDNIYNLNPAFNIKGSSSKKKQIDVQANTSILTNLVVQLELAKINLRKETPLIQLIDSPILPLEKEKISKANATVFGSLLCVLLTILILLLRHSIIKFF